MGVHGRAACRSPGSFGIDRQSRHRVESTHAVGWNERLLWLALVDINMLIHQHVAAAAMTPGTTVSASSCARLGFGANDWALSEALEFTVMP
jgi:hypothetical protein